MDEKEKVWHEKTGGNRKLQYWLDLISAAKDNITEMTVKGYEGVSAKEIIMTRSFVSELLMSMDEARKRKEQKIMNLPNAGIVGADIDAETGL